MVQVQVHVFLSFIALFCVDSFGLNYCLLVPSRMVNKVEYVNVVQAYSATEI